MGIERSLFHVASSIDGARQPYLVSYPQGHPSSEPLPVVVLLHDTLEQPTASHFIEQAFRTAHEWAPAMEKSPPVCLLQPYGRGNAGWIGWGFADLFDALTDLGQRLVCSADPPMLLGIGMGGTAALQLACWYPDRFTSVAAIAPWTDPGFDLPIGCEEYPDWQQPQLRQLSPASLAGNLAAKPVYLEHPWWMTGDRSQTHSGHTQKLINELADCDCVVARPEADPNHLRRDCPADASELLAWLLECRRNSTRERFRFRSYSTLSTEYHGIRIDSCAQPGRAAQFKATLDSNCLKLKTKRVAALTVDLSKLDGPIEQIVLDKQPFDGETLRGGADRIQFEHLGGVWQRVDAEVGGQDEVLTGLHLRRRKVAFVYGTLGDEVTTIAQERSARQVAENWQNGIDSMNPHPGDRTADLQLPIVADNDVESIKLADHDLVVVGNPETNLLLARWRQHLPFEYPLDDQTGMASFSKEGRTYSDPEDGLALLFPQPEVEAGSVLMLAANSAAGYEPFCRLPTALLPTFLVFRGSKVLDWGYLRAR